MCVMWMHAMRQQLEAAWAVLDLGGSWRTSFLGKPATRLRIAFGAPIAAVESGRVTKWTSYGERLNGAAACLQR